MKSEYSLYMDFKKARLQAEELSSLATELRKIGNDDLNDSLARISTFWTGENATRFIGKGNQVKGKILKVADQLDSAASAIKTIARQTYEAEMRALQLAKQVN